MLVRSGSCRYAGCRFRFSLDSGVLRILDEHHLHDLFLPIAVMSALHSVCILPVTDRVVCATGGVPPPECFCVRSELSCISELCGLALPACGKEL